MSTKTEKLIFLITERLATIKLIIGATLCFIQYSWWCGSPAGMSWSNDVETTFYQRRLTMMCPLGKNVDVWSILADDVGKNIDLWSILAVHGRKETDK